MKPWAWMVLGAGLVIWGAAWAVDIPGIFKAMTGLFHNDVDIPGPSDLVIGGMWATSVLLLIGGGLLLMWRGYRKYRAGSN